MRYSLVIFDFDGTLADTFAWFAGTINSVAETFRFRKIDPSEADTLRNLDAKRILARLGVPLWKVPAIARHMRALMNRDTHRISLFRGVDRMLRSLTREGIALAIVSSNSRDNVQTILGPDNAARIAHYDCGASLFGKHTKVRRVLVRAGVRRDRAILVGDEIRDAQAARRVGVAFGAVSWGYNTRVALEACSPDALFESVDDVTAKLASARAG